MNRIDDYRSQKERDAEMQRYMDSRPYGKQRDKIVRIIDDVSGVISFLAWSVAIGSVVYVILHYIAYGN